MAQPLILLLKALIAASALLGLASPFFARRRTIWKALGLWGLGLGAGVACVPVVAVLWRVQARQRAADLAAGRDVPLNDMHGFGEAMLAWGGTCYFAGLLVLILLVFGVSVMIDRGRGDQGG